MGQGLIRSSAGRVIAYAIAYLLFVQVLAWPAAQARALELQRLDAAIQTLCLTDDDGGAGAPERRASHHDLSCCLGAGRHAFDGPAAILSEAAAFAAPPVVQRADGWRIVDSLVRVSTPVAIHHARGPPAFV